jgi:DNA-binding transcriptional regulator YiaG
MPAPVLPAAAPELLGAEIRRVRQSLGMTLVQFGEHVGLPWQTIAGWESGRTTPPSDRLLAIVHATRRAPEPFRVERVAREVAALERQAA